LLLLHRLAPFIELCLPMNGLHSFLSFGMFRNREEENYIK
jgi:hypothetical protein